MFRKWPLYHILGIFARGAETCFAGRSAEIGVPEGEEETSDLKNSDGRMLYAGHRRLLYWNGGTADSDDGDYVEER